MRKLLSTGTFLLLFVLISLTGCSTVGKAQTLPTDINQSLTSYTESIMAEETTNPSSFGGEQIESTSPEVEQISSKEADRLETLQVTVFDVGQGDCILIKIGEHTALIDAGDIGQEALILNYLHDAQIRQLDYLVASHPHADHIGSMSAVIRYMDNIDSILMPDVVHSTATFEQVLEEIEHRDFPVTIPEAGAVFELGGASIQVIAPNNNNYVDLNNYSIVLRLTYGEVSFLCAGDAEDVSESDQLSANHLLKSDILKVAHHGSGSSTTWSYLERIAPRIAVISVGEENTYGHPDSNVLELLSKAGCEVYRTDKDGTVTFTTDGHDITVDANKVQMTTEVTKAPESVTTSETTSPIPKTSTQYIGNKNSNIFHSPSCGTLPAEKNRTYFELREEAISSNFRPCKNCKP